MKLSANFTLYEATYSSNALGRAIHNVPKTQEEMDRILHTAKKMEVVREILGNKAIHINSWYRCPALNKAVGGSETSQHMRGEAVDFRQTARTPREICKILMKNKDQIGYDQLILEPTWVHISFTTGPCRAQELTYLGPGNYQKGIS